MAEQYDGTVRIGTELDPQGAKDGLASLSNGLKSTMANITRDMAAAMKGGSGMFKAAMSDWIDTAPIEKALGAVSERAQQAHEFVQKVLNPQGGGKASLFGDVDSGDFESSVDRMVEAIDRLTAEMSASFGSINGLFKGLNGGMADLGENLGRSMDNLAETTANSTSETGESIKNDIEAPLEGVIDTAERAQEALDGIKIKYAADRVLPDNVISRDDFQEYIRDDWKTMRALGKRNPTVDYRTMAKPTYTMPAWAVNQKFGGDGTVRAGSAMATQIWASRLGQGNRMRPASSSGLRQDAREMATFESSMKGAMGDLSEDWQGMCAGMNLVFGDTVGKVTAQAEAMTATMLRGIRTMVMRMAKVWAFHEVGSLLSTWQQLSTQIGAVNDGVSSTNAVMERLKGIADSSGNAIETLSNEFTASAGALNAMGFSTDQQLDVLQALSDAMKSTGANADQMNAVIKAVTGGMAKGKLAGQDFETVLTKGGEVARGLAGYLGMTVADLKKFADEGKLTSKVIADGLTANMGKWADKAKESPKTVSQALAQLKNEIIAAVGELNESLSTAPIEALVGGVDVLKNTLGTLIGVLPEAAAGLIAFKLASASSVEGMALFGVNLKKIMGDIGAFVSLSKEAGGVMKALPALSFNPLAIALGVVAAGTVYLATRESEAEKIAKQLGTTTDGLKAAYDRLGKEAENAAKRVGAPFEEIEKRLQTSLDLLALTEKETLEDVNRTFQRISGLGEDYIPGFGKLITKASEPVRKLKEEYSKLAEDVKNKSVSFAEAKDRLEGLNEKATLLLKTTQNAADKRILEPLNKQYEDLAKNVGALTLNETRQKQEQDKANEAIANSIPEVRDLNVATEELKNITAHATKEQKALAIAHAENALAATDDAIATKLKALSDAAAVGAASQYIKKLEEEYKALLKVKAAKGEEIEALVASIKAMDTSNKAGRSAADIAREQADAQRQVDMTIAQLNGDYEELARLQKEADWESFKAALDKTGWSAEVAAQKVEEYNKAAEKKVNTEHLQEQLDFYKELRDVLPMAGEQYAALRKQILDTQQRQYEAIGINKEAIDEWRKWAELEEATDFLSGFKVALRNASDEMTPAQAAMRLTETATDSLSEGFYGLIEGTESAGDAFENFARTFCDQLVKMAIQVAVVQPIIQGFMSMMGLGGGGAAGGMGGGLLSGLLGGLLGGGTTTTTSTSSSSFIGVATHALTPYGSAHTGGVVGELAQSRSVSPLAFLGADRYHGGGLIGLQSGEVPIIAKRGERVLTESQNAAYEALLAKTQNMIDRQSLNVTTTAAAPSVNINFINQSGQNLTAQQGPMRSDGQGGFSMDMIVKAIDAGQASLIKGKQSAAGRAIGQQYGGTGYEAQRALRRA